MLHSVLACKLLLNIRAAAYESRLTRGRGTTQQAISVELVGNNTALSELGFTGNRLSEPREVELGEANPGTTFQDGFCQ
jgi:hypothetical protein